MLIAVRRLALLIVLCVSVDFANPMLPGSVRFNADETIEGLRADRVRAGVPTTQAAPPRPQGDHREALARSRVPARPAPLTDGRRRRFRPPGQERGAPPEPSSPPLSADH